MSHATIRFARLNPLLLLLVLNAGAAPLAHRPHTDRVGDPLPSQALARLGTTRWVHHGGVTAVAYSPDGKTLASAGFDNRVRLWDAATGQELRHVKHTGWARAVVWSPDGKSLISAADGDGVRIWDARTGKPLRRLGPWKDQKPWQGILCHLALSADGRKLAVEEQYDIRVGKGSRSGYRVHLWDVARDRALQQFECNHPANSALSPDGTILARGDEGKVRRWRTATGEELPPLACPGAHVSSVAFSPDGRTLASGDSYPKDTIRFWNLATGKERLHLPARPQSSVYGLAYSPDGKILACGCGGVDPALRILDATTGEVRRQLSTSSGAISSLHFSPDGKALAGCGGRVVCVWDTTTGKERSPYLRHRGAVTAVALSPDGRIAATGGDEPVVRLWEAGTAKLLRSLPGHRDRVATVAFAPDGAVLASGGHDRTVRLWNVQTGEELRTLAGHKFGVAALAFSPDGRFLATAEGMTWVNIPGARHPDGAVRLWDVRTGQQLRQFQAKEGRVNALAFSPDGAMLATAGIDDKDIHIWDTITGRKIRRLHSAPDPASARGLFEGIAALAFAPDGQTLAAISFYECKSNLSSTEQNDGLGRMLRVWEVSIGQERYAIRQPRNEITSAVFSSDGRTLILGRTDGDVLLWDVLNGQSVRRLRGHSDRVNAVACAREGQTFLSGSADTTALLWDSAALSQRKPPSARRRTAAEIEALWDDLARSDAPRGYAALRALTEAAPQSVPFLRLHLRSIRLKESQLRRWIAELDDDKFTVREQANQGLEQAGDAVGALLRAALEEKPTLEKRRRLLRLLDILKRPSGGALRAARSVEILLHSGTPTARALLQALAEGTSQARLTRQAKAALRCLDSLPRE